MRTRVALYVGCEHGLADVVVACLFAGVGAWAAKVTVAPSITYATELFGAGHAKIEYPTDMTPMVLLTIPNDAAHVGAAEINFSLVGGGKFASNVAELEWADDGSATPVVWVAAPAAVASVESGGRAGDSSVTIKVGANAATGGRTDAAPTLVRFPLPQLTELHGRLGPSSSHKRVLLNANSRIVSGEFTTGDLTGVAAYPYVNPVTSRDSLTIAIEASGKGEAMKTIALKDDAAKKQVAFKTLKELAVGEYVELATVTVTTKQVEREAKGRELVGYLQDATALADCPAHDTTSTNTNCDAAEDDDQEVYLPPVSVKHFDIYDLDGDKIIDEGEGLRGNLIVNAAGTRDLFNEDDMLFIDYDKNKAMGAGEGIAIDGDTAMGDALSVDADKSDSFDADGTGTFKVYCKPGGKMDIRHDAMITVTAHVDYSDPTAVDEKAVHSTTTLRFDGVNSEVMAYAIPHSANGKGDSGNVRVRCEQPLAGATDCRVFLECWDDDGMRGFGEAPMIAANNVMVWNSVAIEGVIEATPSSRHSCRVLAQGMVTVQQLTRDGSSGTLVNNTYVGE